jgi:TolB protein
MNFERSLLQIIGVMLAMSLLGGCGALATSPIPTEPIGVSSTTSPTSAPITEGEAAGIIAYYSGRNGKYEIYTINPDGSYQQQLTSNDAEDVCPSISPDGSQIAFSSDQSSNFELYLMRINGSGLVRLSETPNRETHPEWSPDGMSIVFTRYPPGTWEGGDIFVINADGSNEQQLTDDPADDMRPVWSPDGSKILFNSNRDGNYEIYTMDANGNNPQRLTNTPINEIFPRLSHDGMKIAYTYFDFETRKAEVHVMNVDGSNDIALASTGRVNENPIWSPDDHKIVFQTNRTGNYEIFIMNADGSEQVNLTNSPVDDYWPSWSSVASSIK